ncbi:hypothetical protein [Desulfogranum mediterraneum]|uniref:hypothetical protein n=1 Tax=Desulfogranum mediterraneum TaxID=160661 RepID=UPI0004024C00|nr:hypothetical protein [Desulfogranum mediterraneum]
MLKRYLLTLVGFLLLCLCYCLTLVPVLLAGAALEGRTYLLTLCSWGFLVLCSLPPAFSLLIGKIWFFPGQGEPLPLEELKSLLLDINALNGPVRTRERRKKLIISWHHQDQAWRKHLERAGLKRLYELHLVFQPATRTVLVSDRFRRVSFEPGTARAKTALFARPRPMLQLKRGEQWNLEAYRGRQAHDFEFRPREIKSPVIGTILNSGWNVRFRCW